MASRDRGSRLRDWLCGSAGWAQTLVASSLTTLIVVSTVNVRSFAADQITGDSGITAWVYNYAKVSGGVLRSAEAEATRVLGAAGVSTVWVDCLAHRDPLPSNPGGANRDCAGPVGEATIILRILPGYSPAKVAFRDSEFGIAAGDVLAYVFYGSIADLAHVDGDISEIPPILGDAIAHEIGHLLLGPGSHSPTGIMCGRWDRSYLRLALKGRMRFTPQQCALLQVIVPRRHKDTIQALDLSH